MRRGEKRPGRKVPPQNGVIGEMGAADEGNEETLLTSITPLLDQSTQLPDQELAGPACMLLGALPRE